MNDSESNVIGTCSICGGRVVLPRTWYGMYPPTPHCIDCGARKSRSNGPVIPMEPPGTPKSLLCEGSKWSGKGHSIVTFFLSKN